ncbi:MAG: transporter substrate-binding domain-containing protein [Candidatus Onthomonas sp.]|nr:transporter substrate-binding domain-containing protein [Candidatus Onthomonas sp.]
MKNMKKALSLVLALVMMLALASCGSAGTGAASGSAADSAAASAPAEGAESDLAYVQDKGTLVVGITDFEPMDYKDENGEWIGFDADMAAAFAKSLGVKVEFIEIDWDNKIMELNSKSIDCVWNGMTLTDEVKQSMATSNPYCDNAQVVVVPADKADQYQDTDSLADLSFAVETGSAGEAEVKNLNLDYTAVSTQADAVMEVSAGSSDACVIDLLMAGAMVGEGTSYPQLTHTVKLNSEQYGVGFRTGSDLVDSLNEFFAASYKDGSMQEIAEKYGVQDSLIAQ